MVEQNEYEAQRAANIAKNQALLRELQLNAASAGLGVAAGGSRTGRALTGASGVTGRDGSTPDGTEQQRRQERRKKTPAATRRTKDIKAEVVPRRTSSRLAGLPADSELAKRKADEENAALQEAARAKRRRVTGDLHLRDVVATGRGWEKGRDTLTDALRRAATTGTATAAPAGSRADDPDVLDVDVDIKDERDAVDPDLKALRRRMASLELYDGFAPNRIKITPERIYSIGFHPTESKTLVLAGDKMGHLGVFDASSSSSSSRDVKTERDDADGDGDDGNDDDDTKDNTIKQEHIAGNDDDDDDEDTQVAEPCITSFKLHTRTISAFVFPTSTGEQLLSASYDSSIRMLDLVTGRSMEVYAPSASTGGGGDDNNNNNNKNGNYDHDEEEADPITALDVPRDAPSTVYFSTMSGLLFRHDLRAPSHTTSAIMRAEPSTSSNQPSSSSPPSPLPPPPPPSLKSLRPSTSKPLTHSFALSEKKLSGFSLHPRHPHLLATASLDRTMKLWDLRHVTRSPRRLPALLGTHDSRLSVSHAEWSERGHVATASYDDTVKIWHFDDDDDDVKAWTGSGGEGGDSGGGGGIGGSGSGSGGKDLMKPRAVVRHNNQTGRWVTVYVCQRFPCLVSSCTCLSLHASRLGTRPYFSRIRCHLSRPAFLQ